MQHSTRPTKKKPFANSISISLLSLWRNLPDNMHWIASSLTFLCHPTNNCVLTQPNRDSICFAFAVGHPPPHRVKVFHIYKCRLSRCWHGAIKYHFEFAATVNIKSLGFGLGGLTWKHSLKIRWSCGGRVVCGWGLISSRLCAGEWLRIVFNLIKRI